LGLTEALDAMIDRVAASTSIHFERKLERLTIYLGENLHQSVPNCAGSAHNLMKHATASSAQVHLIRDLRHVQLIVADNGCVLRFQRHQRNGGLGLARSASAFEF